jgi:regulator of sigma E protease
MSGAGAWVLVFAGFCLLIVLHEAGHFAAAKATGMRVEKFFLFFGPKLISVRRGETEYGVAAIPIGGFVKISGMNPEEELPPEVAHRAYYRQPVWKRIVVIGAGPAVNILLAFAILFAVFWVNAQQRTQTVGEVIPDTPAAGVLRPGDRVLAVDGASYARLDDEARLERFVEAIESHRCAGQQAAGCRAATPVRLRIERSGEVRTIAVRPEYDRTAKRMLVGFAFRAEPDSISAGRAAGRAWTAIWTVTSKTAEVFSHLFESSQRREITSVVGIGDVAHQTIDRSAEEALLLLALVSLSLGLLNLLPILPLDGGHIFWSLAEKLRGRPVPLRVIERATMVGIALVAMLVFIGLSNDIGRLSGDGFKTR